MIFSEFVIFFFYRTRRKWKIIRTSFDILLLTRVYTYLRAHGFDLWQYDLIVLFRLNHNRNLDGRQNDRNPYYKIISIPDSNNILRETGSHTQKKKKNTSVNIFTHLHRVIMRVYKYIIGMHII